MMKSTVYFVTLALALGAAGYAGDNEPPAVSVYPAEIELSTSRDRQSYVVQMTAPDGVTTDITDEAAVTAKYQIPGRSYAAFAALRGDPSDGLPGVPGVGEKTAAALVRSFGSVDGMLAAMKARGLTPEPRYVRSGEFREDAAYSVARSLLEQPDRPTALYVASGVMALGAMRAIADLGLRCPPDISIASTDGAPHTHGFSAGSPSAKVVMAAGGGQSSILLAIGASPTIAPALPHIRPGRDGGFAQPW